MKLDFRTCAAAALALGIAACGAPDSDADQAETPAAESTGDVVVDELAPEAEPTGEDSEEETVEAEPTPAPSPSASTAPSPTPSATATTAAVAKPAAFNVCGACHSVEPDQNGIGPSLAGIYGEKAGAVPGFEFSQAMKDSGIVWNEATLDNYLENPKQVVPGTIMSFGGVKDDAKRQQIIEYIKGL